MTPTQFRAALTALGLTQTGAAAALRVDARTVRRWASGERRVPGTVERLLWAMEQWPELRLMLAAAPDDMELRLEAQAVAAWHGVGVTSSHPTNEGTEQGTARQCAMKHARKRHVWRMSSPSNHNLEHGSTG